MYPLKNTLVVDDTPLTFSRNWANGVFINSFSGGKDEELTKIITWLVDQHTITNNVRLIQRPRWYES